MMYAELYQYLILHKQLSIPGIGLFSLERKPAKGDFLNRQIHPPVYSVALQTRTDPPAMSFFRWLGAALGISDRDAVVRFNDFAFDLKKHITGGDRINWKGVGTLTRGPEDAIEFTPWIQVSPEKPVHAEKLIRENAEHMVRVGEEERTSAEMTEMLSKPAEKKSYWWVYALALCLVAIMFIGWYLSEQGVTISSAANTNRLTPAEAGTTYKILP